jgi:hypothetical protein
VISLRLARSLLVHAAVAAAGVVLAASPSTAQPPSGDRATTAGRVVATITALEGAVRMAGVDVELRLADAKLVVAKTATDAAGQVTFFDVPAGRYVVSAARPGFQPTESTAFEVRPAETAQVLLEIRLTFVAPDIEVQAPISVSESVQPVSSSDMLAGSVLDVAPVEGDDFQSLLPLLPGVVRGPDGRLRAKGGQPTQGALQISSTSLVDPSSGDIDLELPGQSLESVELLSNPFAAEYGRFSSSVVQIQTRRGTNDWEIGPGNLVPRLRGLGKGLRRFEPRFSMRGPIARDRLFIAQDFQFRYVSDPVKSLPDEPTMNLMSFDSFTRLDGVISTRHSLGGLLVAFPRKVDHLTMNTFRPPEVTPSFSHSGASAGLQDRFAFAQSIVLESTLAVRSFEVEVKADGTQPMVYSPELQRGSFFNDQERDVRSVQWVEALSIAVDRGRGEHVVKLGLDMQRSSYEGLSTSRAVEIRRLDDSLAERTEFGAMTRQQVNATELALFAQDRWRIMPRVTLEYGIRMDREDVIDRVSWSPRGGASVAVLPEGRGILRGGVGRFRQRTPLNVGAFMQLEPRVVTRFAPDGRVISGPLAFRHRLHDELRTPEAVAGNVEWNQRFGRRLLFKANFLRRNGAHEYILTPDRARGEIVLSSSGRSTYQELELTGRYLNGERRDVTVSYVRSRGTGDLNDYDQFYGNLRNPLVRENQHNLVPHDVPHRLLVRGTIGLPGSWMFAPVLEMRSGFPWSAVDEYGDFVGPRNRAGRFPTVRTFDFAVSRPWRLRKYRFRAGVRVYNLFGSSSARDVQHNVTSPQYGHFFNPLERSIGFVFGSAR